MVASPASVTPRSPRPGFSSKAKSVIAKLDFDTDIVKLNSSVSGASVGDDSLSGGGKLGDTLISRGGCGVVRSSFSKPGSPLQDAGFLKSRGLDISRRSTMAVSAQSSVGSLASDAALERSVSERFEHLSGTLRSTTTSQQEIAREVRSRVDDVEAGLRTAQARCKDLDIFEVRMSTLESLLETFAKKSKHVESRIEAVAVEQTMAEARQAQELVALRSSLEADAALTKERVAALHASMGESIAQLEESFERGSLAQRVDEFTEERGALLQRLDGFAKAVELTKIELSDSIRLCEAESTQECSKLARRVESRIEAVAAEQTKAEARQAQELVALRSSLEADAAWTKERVAAIDVSVGESIAQLEESLERGSVAQRMDDFMEECGKCVQRLDGFAEAFKSNKVEVSESIRSYEEASRQEYCKLAQRVDESVAEHTEAAKMIELELAESIRRSTEDSRQECGSLARRVAELAAALEVSTTEHGGLARRMDGFAAALERSTSEFSASVQRCEEGSGFAQRLDKLVHAVEKERRLLDEHRAVVTRTEAAASQDLRQLSRKADEQWVAFEQYRQAFDAHKVSTQCDQEAFAEQLSAWRNDLDLAVTAMEVLSRNRENDTCKVDELHRNLLLAVQQQEGATKALEERQCADVSILTEQLACQDRSLTTTAADFARQARALEASLKDSHDSLTSELDCHRMKCVSESIILDRRISEAKELLQQELSDRFLATSEACEGLTQAQNVIEVHIRSQDAVINEVRAIEAEISHTLLRTKSMEKAMATILAQRGPFAGGPEKQSSWAEWGNQVLDSLASPRAVSEGHASVYEQFGSRAEALQAERPPTCGEAGAWACSAAQFPRAAAATPGEVAPSGAPPSVPALHIPRSVDATSSSRSCPQSAVLSSAGWRAPVNSPVREAARPPASSPRLDADAAQPWCQDPASSLRPTSLDLTFAGNPPAAVQPW